MSTTLGQTIREARKARGWSLKTFSEKIGISIMTLQRIETGQVSPSVKLMVDIAAHLDRPITDFIQDKERILVRLKSNRIKSWEAGHSVATAIFPTGIIQERMGINLLELQGDESEEWQTDDSYQGFHLLEGEAKIEFGDNSIALKPGETIYFDARYKHRLTGSKGALLVSAYRR